MSSKIQISKIEKSRISEVDFDNLIFGREFSDHMFEVDYENGEWVNARIRPLANLSIHPGNLAWHYGQSIFEGMKASLSKDGIPTLFRPEKHVERINESATRMCMPTISEELFLDAINKLVYLDKDWIPKEKGSALYIRPLMIAMDEAIGVRPSERYKFLIMTLPVGPYYPKPVSLKADTKYIRAGQGGVGEAKTAGNYAASLYPAKLAKEEGYDQIMWLDALEFKYIQEVGTMNIFFVLKNNIVLTPITNGTILKGITRDSMIKVMKSKNIDVVERLISIDEIVEAHNNGELLEVFGTGTAAVVAAVSKFKYKDKVYNLDNKSSLGAELKNYIDELRFGTIKDDFNWIKPISAT